MAPEAIAAVSAAGEAHPRERIQLGELLLQRGILTTEQLERALAEQQVRKRPLGELVVELGFVSAPTIAQALATQHGGLLKSEYGFATGFDARLDVGNPAAPPVSVRALPTREPPAPASAPAREPDPELAAAEARLDDLAQQLATAAPRIAAAEAAAAALGERVRELESELERERDARQALEEQVAPEPVPPPAAAHLLFFHAGERGYVVVERPGPAPAGGTAVDASAFGGPASAQVAKVGAAPIPGSGLSCAYLL